MLTIDEGVENELSVLLDQVVDVTKDAAVYCQSWCYKLSSIQTYHMVGQVAKSKFAVVQRGRELIQLNE